MAGKKQIIYPIDFTFKTGNVEFFCNGKEAYSKQKSRIDKIIDALNANMQVGYVGRDRKRLPHGINAHSVNKAFRERLLEIPDMHTETAVAFGSFLPQNKLSAFDFCIYDRDTNYYSFWNHCFGENAVWNGQAIFEEYINDKEIVEEWKKFKTKKQPVLHSDLFMPSDVCNIIGEIQFGNWAMIYKDMFRLIGAINQKAHIGLYIYIAAVGNLRKLLSDHCVNFDDAKPAFQENINNRSINVPIMLIPVNIEADLTTYNFTEVAKKYNEICDEVDKLSKEIKRYSDKIQKLEDAKKMPDADDVTKQKLEKQIKNNITRKKNKEKALEELNNLYSMNDKSE